MEDSEVYFHCSLLYRSGFWSPTSCLGPSDTRIGTDRYALGDLWIMQRERIGTRLVLGCCVGNSQSGSPMASLAQSKLCQCQGLDNRKQRLVLVNPKALLVSWGQQSGQRSTASLRAMRCSTRNVLTVLYLDRPPLKQNPPAEMD